MSQVTTKLHQLRGFFIFYFVAQLFVDVVMGWDLARVSLGRGRGFGPGRLGFSRGAFLMLTLLFAGVLFALALWFFQQMIQRKNWARIVLLIVGWVTVADALLSWLFTTQAGGFTPWLFSLVPGLDWQRALLVDRVKDFLGLLFWAYLIYVLQFTLEVKRSFLPSAQASGSVTPPPAE